MPDDWEPMDDTDSDCYVCDAPTLSTSSEPGPRGRAAATTTVTIYLDGKKTEFSGAPKEPLLETARRAGLTPPFSCEAGNCGTCIARLTDGGATMQVNDALTDDEVAEGYVLTCQAIPDTPSVTVHYED
jgi:ferredoxin